MSTLKLTPLQRRAARRARDGGTLDLNLVSLIDIFTILIFFLMLNLGVAEILPTRASIDLPEARVQALPAPGVVVMVGRDGIAVDGRPVAELPTADAGDIHAAAGAIPALVQALQQVQATHPTTQASSTTAAAALRRRVTVMADRSVPFAQLRRVMTSCAEAGFTDVSFAVQQKAGT